jgi:cytochrome c oxidase subunit 2
MRIAIAILMVAAGTLAFHFLSPWWWTPIASNWGFIDQTIIITFWITGAVFVAVVGFMAWCLYKYRHREGHKAEYEPESKKLEIWLTLGTAVGVVALLTPGLFAWADYVSVPDDALDVEVVGQQWTWSYRYPGADGVLGTSDMSNVTPDNPFGLHIDDAHGQDDILVNSAELHMLLGQPTRVLMRSKDVLHNFYVPQFRAKMDMVPGMVTFFWVEPTRTGKFDVLCAELCGTGHYQMRGKVVVDEADDFAVWLDAQPTFAETMNSAGGATGEVAQADDPAAAGRQLAESRGCLGCHTLDGGQSVGPTWQGLYGKTEDLDGGGTAVADDAYLIESIADPNAQIVAGFGPSMPAYEFSDDEYASLIAFIRSISE